MYIPTKIGISPTLKIRGIIAIEPINKGSVVERCPILLFPNKQEEHFMKTIMKNYYFDWNKKYCCIALGYGSLINHSFHPNVEFTYNYKTKEIIFRALKPIKEGEELFINYNGESKDQSPVEVALDHDTSAYTIK